jgi:hypothetical protein
VSTTWAWFLLGAIVLLLLLRRYAFRTQESATEQVRYMIQSSGAPSAAQQLGATSGLQVTRYYFRQTDTKGGPDDCETFYDEFFIDLRDPESGQTWQNTIHVATPRGLDRLMAEEHWDSVIGTELLIVRKFDLETILQAAVEHLEEIYEVQLQFAGQGIGPPRLDPPIQTGSHDAVLGSEIIRARARGVPGGSEPAQVESSR